MTRTPNRRLLALALVSALGTTAAPALAQSVDPFALAAAPESAPAGSFTVSDIRIDGLQRISAGTVFTYLPIERGDTADSARIGEAIRALYKTGFFEDVNVGRQGDILVVTVTERPAINKLTLTGNKDIKSEDLLKGLKEAGLSEGDTFDRLALDRVTQELTRQYNNRGKYNVEINPTVSRLDRNRVDVTIAVKEGKAAKIRHVNLIGNEKFADEDILETWESREHNWLSWYRRDDQYSREKLSGDLEKLNNWYLDRGYVDFSVDSTQVSISPDRQDMFLTAGVTEGEQYKVSSVQVTGDTILPKEQIERLVLVKPDQIFSAPPARDQLRLDHRDAEQRRLRLRAGQPDPRRQPRGQDRRHQHAGGAGAARQRAPHHLQGQHPHQRRGGTSRDAPVRGFSWYSQAAIDRSKIRLQQLGYFETVDVETEPVAGTNDQVDVIYNLKETTSGSFVFGLGFSQLSGLTAQIQLSQTNFLGSGNQVSVQAQRNDYMQRYDFSFRNPYFTDNGLSLGYNLWWRELDYSDFNTAQYSTNSGAAQAVFGLPITETDTVTAMLGIDTNEILVFGSTPPSIQDYINALDQSTFHAWRAEVGWGRNSLDSFLTPTRGMQQRVWLETTLPGSTVEYYKLNYNISKFWPLSRHLVLNTRAELGYGDSYGDATTRNLCRTPGNYSCVPGDGDFIRTITADGLPFFENFYAGGVRSVRGFTDNTLGPRELNQPLGGAFKTVGSLEMYFPTLLDTPAARVSAFVDVGNVYKDYDAFDADELRASTGVALMWRSPMGPISISYAFPLKKEDAIRDASGNLIQEGDELERLQFTFGGTF